MFLTESMWLEPPGLNNLLEQDKSSAWKSDWHRRVTGAQMKYELLLQCAVISSCSNYPRSTVSINPVCLVIYPVPFFLSYILSSWFRGTVLIVSIGSHFHFFDFLWASFNACVCQPTSFRKGWALFMWVLVCVWWVVHGMTKILYNWMSNFWATLYKVSWNNKC